ncbi:MAG: hypothetical protein GX879_02515, partial [Bacteroidales bacterium]|nr:hypothetical protein [Bacteroidales bacterium]
AKQHSEDESAKVNKGSLNWRTVFGLVYEFETAMYETEVGQFSEPIRSRFGYHIVKVNDKRPAKGKYKVAHIMFITPRGIAEKTLKEIEEKVFMVYDKVKAGENFENLAKEFSDDRQTAANGGNLGWVEVGGKMIKEFENLVFSLEEIGETSEPLRTSYGWHIIKLLDKEDVKDFDDLKADLKNKISNSAQASKSKDVVIANLKKEYNYKLNQKALEDFYVIVTDSIFEGTWDVSEAEQLKDVICEFGDQKMYQYEFAEYLNKFNRKQNNQNIQNFVNSIYDGFHRKAISSYERTQLERKYPSFKFLMQEYHDGILLFDLTDQIVWSKAVADTLGLEKFYNQNKDKYMWDTRYEVKKYTYTNEKKMKALNKMLVKNTSDEKIFAKLNKKDARALQLVINDKFLPSQDSEADELIKQANLGSEPNAKKVFSLDKNTIVSVQQIPPTNKTINEARGIITADYQNYLEQEWIKILRAKYNIVVHEDVLKSIASKK